MFKAFWRNESGGVALIFGLAAVVLVGCMGVALDFARASDLRARLQASADASVLNALNPLSGHPNPAAQAEEFFRAMLSADDAAAIRDVRTTLERDPDGAPNRLDIQFDAEMPTTLVKVLGFPHVPVGGQAAAVVGVMTRSRFHFLVDTSDSMGLAATVEARDRLRQLTASEPAGSCEFACHNANSLKIARANDITLRVDVARRGAERMIELAREYGGSQATFTFSLHAVDSQATVVSPLTSNIDAILAAMERIEVGYGHTGDDADTYFESVLPQVADWLDNAGATGPDEVVVLVTDGVRSQNDGWRPDVRPISPAYCDELKSGNRQVAVIYTEYLPIVNNTTYNETVAHFRQQLEPNLRACASDPDLYGRGDSPDEIYQAFERVFLKTLRKQVRLAS